MEGGIDSYFEKSDGALNFLDAYFKKCVFEFKKFLASFSTISFSVFSPSWALELGCGFSGIGSLTFSVLV